MCNITFAYERDPDDSQERNITLTFGAEIDMTYSKLVEMFVDFSRVLGYCDFTIDKYINLEGEEDDD